MIKIGCNCLAIKVLESCNAKEKSRLHRCNEVFEAKQRTRAFNCYLHFFQVPPYPFHSLMYDGLSSHSIVSTRLYRHCVFVQIAADQAVPQLDRYDPCYCAWPSCRRSYTITCSPDHGTTATRPSRIHPHLSTSHCPQYTDNPFYKSPVRMNKTVKVVNHSQLSRVPAPRLEPAKTFGEPGKNPQVDVV